MIQVVDTSVAIKWFIQERGQEQALGLLHDLLAHPQHYAVPELFYFELVHVFNRMIPSPNEGQLEILSQICMTAMNRFSMTADLMNLIRVFQKKGLSGYDASYVALAKILGGIWVTFDQKAHQKIAALRLSKLLE